MSATAGTFENSRPRWGDLTAAWVRRNGWTIGLVVFLGLLFVLTKFLQPTYGPIAIEGLAISVLALGLASVGQAIVVISGGIDLSNGSMMALAACVAAANMKGQSEEWAIAVFVGVLLLGLVLGAINGGLVVLTRVPDIIVTLATSFVWAGAALLVLKTPGGRSSEWLMNSITGSVVLPLGVIDLSVPLAAIVLVAIVAIVWLPFRRSRHGLSLYAVGSNQLAAFRSGVSVGRTKIMAYALAGLFSALAGLSLVAQTGIGDPKPGPYTLQSVAAVVLGGVSLAGGRGGVFGALVGVVILQLIQTDIAFLNLDPNYATVSQGLILIGVVMIGSLIQIRRARA